MPDSHYRMMPDHPRSSVAHDLFNSLAHFRLVAVNRAVLAGGFFDSKGTFIEAFFCIVPQF
jgi:hypothetical protein